MPTVAEFSIPTEEFALHDTLEQCPDLQFEVDRVVAHDTSRVMPYVWVMGEGQADLTEILEADPSVESVELLTESEDERFYKLEWAGTARVIGYMVLEEEATVQRALAAQDEWTLRVLFPDREGVSATHDFASGEGLSLEINRIYGVGNAENVQFGLTEPQHETLVEAYEQGYYKIPRETDAKQLATALNVSHQALSERLRRASESLIENSLLVDEDAAGQ